MEWNTENMAMDWDRKGKHGQRGEREVVVVFPNLLLLYTPFPLLPSPALGYKMSHRVQSTDAYNCWHFITSWVNEIISKCVLSCVLSLEWLILPYVGCCIPSCCWGCRDLYLPRAESSADRKTQFVINSAFYYLKSSLE